ncbi:MAG TPA: DUF4296 domain-containing protein [Prolixibacteraceae bacterium]
MKYRHIFYLLGILIITACNNLPKGILPANKMVPILVDIHLAEAINNQKYNISLLRDSLPEDLFLSICRKHKIETTDLGKSLFYYGKHTREYMPIYDQVLDVLSEMEIKAKGDTIRTPTVGGFDLDTLKTKKSSPPPAKSDIKIK